MARIRTSLVLALSASLLLSGCAASGGDAAPAPTAAPATGETVKGDGYSFTVPEGWGFPDQGVPGQTAKTFAADLGDDDGFADNVNVLASPAGHITADQVESAGVDELESAGATDVSARDRLTVAGSESAHLSADFSASGVDYRIDQYYVSDDDQTYVVTFSFSKTVSQADRDDLAQSVLATWSWS